MSELPIPRPEIIDRLKKTEGQIKGIQKMVINERPCSDVLIQLSAVNSALNSIAGLVLQNYASICSEEMQDIDPRELGKKLAQACAIWMGGRVA